MDAGQLLRAGVEDLVVAVCDGDVDAIADEGEGVGDEVDLRSGGQPEMAAHRALGEGEGAAFGDGDESPAHVKVGVEVGGEAADFAVLFVDPDGAFELAEGSFGFAVGMRAAISGEVEDERWASVNDGTSRAGELHDGEQL